MLDFVIRDIGNKDNKIPSNYMQHYCCQRKLRRKKEKDNRNS